MQNIRIKLRSFDHSILEKAVYNIVNASLRTGSKVCGPIAMPTKIKKFTVLRSPHIDKKSREQFEIRKYKKIIDILDPTPQTIDALMKLELSSGVDVDIKL